MSNFLSKIFAFSREEKRISSSEFEAAVNAALLSDTVADATKGPFISEEGALNLSAVWACVRILSETVGTLPVYLYHRTTDGRETFIKAMTESGIGEKVAARIRPLAVCCYFRNSDGVTPVTFLNRRLKWLG